jgi:hypothetical protein
MAFELAYRNAGSTRTEPCPGCGEPELRLRFLVTSAGAVRGTAVFWCDYCLRGLIPLRTLVPDGVETVLRGTETIPNYTIVPEQ